MSRDTKLRDIYYRFTEPQIPSNHQIVGFEYRGFFLNRNNDFRLWQINLPDGGEPPTELLGKFTTEVLVKQALDSFLEIEEKKQHEANERNNSNKASR